jgi:hypothetical protein
MKAISTLLLAGFALAPFSTLGQLSLEGPGGIFALEDTFGAYEPLVLSPGASDSVLYQNVLLLQTDPAAPPTDIYFEGTFELISDTTTSKALAYDLGDLSVVVSFALLESIPGLHHIGMEISLSNVGGSALEGILTNYWDFSLDPLDPGADFLGLALTGDRATYTLTNASTEVSVFASAEGPSGYGAGAYPDFLDGLWSGPLGALGTGLPGAIADDWTFAFEHAFSLDLAESVLLRYEIGLREAGEVVIPEPSLAGLLALPVVGLLLGLRRRRA